MAVNEEMKNENNEEIELNELSEQEMKEIAGGGVHIGDGRLVVTPTYSCNYFKGDGGHFGMMNCAHCDYKGGKAILMVCNHPGNRR